MLYQTEKIIAVKELESIQGWTCAFSSLGAYFISTSDLEVALNS